ncbi:alpha/beta hydrolase [Microbacterium sp. Marseille-Q6965]|uniref:alpha/beta hydrolase n=1 Tax=Microbacterium sp. Marseille-Q6965 TaxID=2965072 RepID=UPI0021B7F747|nr:alpha/beta hydrolase-fold protein [Microbacterium sp. Marseille-Q6965]
MIPALDDAAVLWSGERDGRPLLVLLHGYGSDERDLFALARQLPDGFAFASVRAPTEPPWPTPGYAWYALEGEGARDPEVVTQAAARVIEWIDRTGHDGPVGLFGFSQGASVALQAMRLTPQRFAFAVNLAGYVAPGALAGDAVLARTRPPVFWGRGTADAVIPEALVVHTTDWLPGHADLVGRTYPGLTHAVSEQELGDVRVFLEKRLRALADQG